MRVAEYENTGLSPEEVNALKHKLAIAEEALKLAVFDYKACVENEVYKKYKTKAEEILYIREQTEIEMDKILSMLKEKNEYGITIWGFNKLHRLWAIGNGKTCCNNIWSVKGERLLFWRGKRGRKAIVYSLF
ncbi:MAG: hypothetical protein EOM76_06880 [Sphingobacteriia bacterium]|nr:hypothetical protein [Sphingobacteriia bacterium]